MRAFPRSLRGESRGRVDERDTHGGDVRGTYDSLDYWRVIGLHDGYRDSSLHRV